VLLARSVSLSVSGCRLEDMLTRVPRRLQSVCQKPLTTFESRSLTNTRGSIVCRLPLKANWQFPLLLRFLFTAETWPLELDGRPQLAQCQSLCSLVGVLNSLGQLCATVWVEPVKREESPPFVVESLLVDTQRNAHKIFYSILANSFPPESAERFSKSTTNSFLTR
jgi:hypothetical protein